MPPSAGRPQNLSGLAAAGFGDDGESPKQPHLLAFVDSYRLDWIITPLRVLQTLIHAKSTLTTLLPLLSFPSGCLILTPSHASCRTITHSPIPFPHTNIYIRCLMFVFITDPQLGCSILSCLSFYVCFEYFLVGFLRPCVP